MQEENKNPDITLDDVDRAPNSISPSKTDVPVSLDELNAAFSRVTEENAKLLQENETLRKKVKTIEILDSLIEPYAKKAYFFMCAYSAVVAIYLFMFSFDLFKNPPGDTVLEFLVGSTAATVIGLVGMVLTGIFIGARNNNKF